MSGSPRGSLNFYEGSRLLLPYTEIVGLPLDQLNFLAVQVGGMLIGLFFFYALSPRHVSANVRHAVEILLGIAATYFCFGSQIVHLFLQTTICLLLIHFWPKNKSPHIIVFVVAMAYLSYMHIYRLMLDYGGYTLDITGPMMIATMRMTSVACSIYDGTQANTETLGNFRKKVATDKLPSIIEYYSYMFYYHGLMAGPFCFYKDYVSFIDGSCFKVDGKFPDKLPSPWKAIFFKLLMLIVNAYLMLFVIPMYPLDNLKDPKWLANKSWIQMQLYMLISVSLIRARYYFAWMISDMTNNAFGLGFSGYNSDGSGRWDKITNMAIWQLETCTSLKLNIDAWNIGTTQWLRQCVYERAPKSVNTFAVFVFAAMWHGFYPGYYICFCTAALFTFAARSVRRTIRPLVLDVSGLKFAYDVVTFVFTRYCNVYMSAPLALLFLESNYIMFSACYYYLHLLATAALILMPLIKSFLPRSTSASSASTVDTTPQTSVETKKDI